jgi:hypothetical protein
LDGRGGESVVALGLGANLNEIGQVTFVTSQLLVRLVMVNISCDIVQESGVVRNNETGDVGMRLEVVLEPSDVGNIKMVSRFVQKENVSTLEHSSGQSQLHLPTSRKGTNSLSLSTLGASSEAELGQNLRDTLTALSGNLRVLSNKLKNADVSVFALVVLDIAGTENVLRRESLELAVSNASHESRLSSTVAAAKTISVTFEESQVGV